MPKHGIYRIFRTKEEHYAFVLSVEFLERTRTMDAVVLALKQVFKCGEKKYAEFSAAFTENYNMIVDLQNEDVRTDKKCEYSKAHIDRLLKQCVGEKLFIPWEERYTYK